jgi:uncharacterized membrane protein YeaQ/YmgE (transglycosylase-associated protein family)
VHVVGFLVFGLLIGGVTSTLVAIKPAGGWGVSMLCGVLGALIGGFFGRVAGLYGDGEPTAFVMALLGAFALVAVYHTAVARRRAV